MLISFSISNYRSIRDKATISFLPAKGYKELSGNITDINDTFKVLRSAVLYGHNASGKSNILNALLGFIDFVNQSSNNKEKDKIEIFDPFLLDDTSAKKPSEFELEFIIDNIRYIYIVSCDSNNVISEHLYYYPKKQKVVIYERDDVSNFKYGTVLKGEKKSIENRLFPNQLYLSKVGTEKLTVLNDIFNFFVELDSFYSRISGLADGLNFSTMIGSALKEGDERYFKRLEKIITSLDFGIHSLKIVDNISDSSFWGLLPGVASDYLKADTFGGAPELKYNLITTHKYHSEETDKVVYRDFPLSRESAGTRNLILIAFVLLDHFQKGTLMIVDEFERSLHPNIVHKLVRLFHDPELNINNAQLLFSTHATNLLDNMLFRRDQIWFTEKDENGATELYSLSEVEGVRKDAPYDKWYLSGRFGATPILYEPELNFKDDVQETE